MDFRYTTLWSVLGYGLSLGKTVCTLTAIDDLIYDSLEIQKVLVISPLRVAQSVWAAEAGKWSHLRHLTISRVLGTEKQRRAALSKPADLYVINRENVPWLVKSCEFDFDMVVIDELSSFKNASSQRFKALRKVIRRAKRVVGLTGTPAPNGYMDLWAEVYLLDKGERLGKTISSFRRKYFRPGWSNGFVVYEYIMLPGSDSEIQQKISDLCISMTKEDYLDMPEILYLSVVVELPPAARVAYDKMERDSLVGLPEGQVTALTAAVVNTKLQQMAGGAVYDEEGKCLSVHDIKLDALESLVEEANGQPVLVFVAYRHEIDRIQKRFGAKAHRLDTEADIEAWNMGQYPIAVAHPASVGHGLNLQEGGHIAIWFGLTWSLELYQQANNRLHRQGQKHTVSIYHLVAKDTVDEACLAALEKKEEGQSALMAYLQARRRQLR